MATRQFEEILDFLGAVDLKDIVVHKERARRVAWDSDQIARGLPAPDIRMGVNVSGNTARFRFRMVFVDENAEYDADFEAAYSAADETDIAVNDSLKQDFAQRVAFMAVYPFIRASVFGGASRLGTPRPVLGIVRQGEFEAGEVLTPEDVRATFLDTTSELDRE